MKKTRPFLKWAGNKYRCLNHILTEFTPSSRLIEPFSGSASIFLNTNYANYLLAEKNLDLIVLFSLLQKNGESFIHYCKSFFNQDNNNATNYYHFREEFNQSTDENYKSALFLYLNRHGYNGLCRYNRRGLYNVPFGRYIKPYFPEAEMRLFHEKSQCAEFLHADFRDTFLKAKRGDVIYCDPPYSPILQKSNFSSYIGNTFGEAEQIELANLAKKASKKGIKVIISNHDTEFTRALYQESEIKSFSVKRSISRNPVNRLLTDELIAIYQ